MFLTNPFPNAFGLDIGDLSIKLVQLERRLSWRRCDNFRVREVRTMRLPPGLIVNGDIEQPELVRKKILQLLAWHPGTKRPLTTKWVVANLPEPKTFLKLITVSAPVIEVNDDAIIFEAKKHLPFALEGAYLDWQIVPGADLQNTSVLIGAVPKVTADAYTYLLESVDLHPLAFEIEAAAVARSMITGTKLYAGEARVILDLGATRSHLIVYDHGCIQFSTTLPFSGELLTMAIVQQLKIDYTMAEKLKLDTGLRHTTAYPMYLPAIHGIVEQLITDIKRALLFYKEHFPEPNQITHITLCGGTAQLKNISTVLSSKLKISSHPGNVWKNIMCGTMNEIEKSQGLSLAAVLGLAIRATHEYHDLML